MSRAAPSSVPVTPSSRISTVIPRPFLVSFGSRLPQPTPLRAHTLFASAMYLLALLQRMYARASWFVSPSNESQTVFGGIMRCNTRDFVQRRIRSFGIFEHNLTYYTIASLCEGDLYVDIGANVGYFTLLASRLVGKSGKVISVEADPVTFMQLLDNLKRNDCRNVSARNVAATATACRVAIDRTELHNSGTHSIRLEGGEVSVEGVPFRDIVGDELKRVHFIKIDIEGSEGPILSGILEVLQDLPHDLIIASEICPASAEHVSRFVAAGFRAYAISNIYTVDYYLIRSYLRRYGEDMSIQMVPVSGYEPSCRDYIFERADLSNSN